MFRVKSCETQMNFESAFFGTVVDETVLKYFKCKLTRRALKQQKLQKWHEMKKTKCYK